MDAAQVVKDATYMSQMICRAQSKQGLESGVFALRTSVLNGCSWSRMWVLQNGKQVKNETDVMKIMVDRQGGAVLEDNYFGFEN